MKNYWSNRTSRRRVLTGGASLSLSAAALAFVGCGDDSDGGDSGAASTGAGLVGEIRDTTSEARKGGTWQDYIPSDSPTLDPIASLSFRIYQEATLVYSFLTRSKLTKRGEPTYGSMEGDAAESWEVAPDGLSLTFKLRPNHRYDSRPPTNGRPLDAEDVKWSFNYFSRVSRSAADVVNSVNPASPVLSLETPNSSTVKFNLAYPWPDALEAFGYNWFLYLMPREADGGFDPKLTMRGSGPFLLEDYQPSIGFKYRRRDDWHVSGRPFLDGINRTIVTEYATSLGQFEAGNLWSFFGGLTSGEDIVAVKGRHPEMVLAQDPGFTALVTSFWSFSSLPTSPFRDQRVRQAANMVIERDLFIETMDGGSKFEAAGLPATTRWHSHIGNGNSSWLDPKGAELGEGAKYFKYDVAEAKKLLNAAGHNSTLKVPFTYFDTGEHGPTAVRAHEVFVSMMDESQLFQVDRNPVHYNNVWQPTCQFGKGNFEGICYSTRASYNLMDFILQSYTPQGKWAFGPSELFGLSDVQPLIQKMRVESDQATRDQMSKDLQRRLAVSMPALPRYGTTLGYSLRWPWFMNHGLFNTAAASSRPETQYWFDATKKS